MQVYTEEFLDMKIAIGVVESHANELTDRERRLLASALEAVRSAEFRLKEANKKQARYMKRRRNLHHRA